MYQNHTYAQDFKALALFRSMVERVPAYSAFLKQSGFNAAAVKTSADLQQVPIMDKKNYIDAFALPELCWDGQLAQNSYIVNSSGSSGVPYYWPRDEAANKTSNRLYEYVLKQLVPVHQPVLLVNSFAQGSWMAGSETFLASQQAHSKQLPVVTINSGIDSNLILAQLQSLAPYFRSIVFSGYPPFIKDLFDTIRRHPQLLRDEQSVAVIVAGESISESWRAQVAQLLKTKNPVKIIAYYGMSDGGGLLAFETPQTIAIRQHIFTQRSSSKLADTFGGAANNGLFQYDPAERSFTQGPDGQLLIHSKYGLPLFNYDSKDRGDVIPFDQTQMLMKTTGLDSDANSALHLPFLYLLSRSDLCVTFYGLNIYPEHIRAVLDERFDPDLTGRFILEKFETKQLDQKLRITVELVDKNFSPAEKAAKRRLLQHYIYTALPRYNSEYAKLAVSLGNRAKPTVIVSTYGSIGYVTGKKHRWVKKD